MYIPSQLALITTRSSLSASITPSVGVIDIPSGFWTEIMLGGGDSTGKCLPALPTSLLPKKINK